MNNVITFDDIKFYSVSDGIEVWACKGLDANEFMKWYLKEHFGEDSCEEYAINDFEELSEEYVLNNPIRVDEGSDETRKAGDIFKERMFAGDSLPMMIWTTEW